MLGTAASAQARVQGAVLCVGCAKRQLLRSSVAAPWPKCEKLNDDATWCDARRDIRQRSLPCTFPLQLLPLPVRAPLRICLGLLAGL